MHFLLSSFHFSHVLPDVFIDKEAEILKVKSSHLISSLFFLFFDICFPSVLFNGVFPRILETHFIIWTH